jgi:hypothetical protein
MNLAAEVLPEQIGVMTVKMLTFMPLALRRWHAGVAVVAP